MEELMLVVVRLLKVATPCIFLDFFLPTAGAGGAVAAGRGFLLLLLLLLLLISGVVCGKQRRQIISKLISLSLVHGSCQTSCLSCLLRERPRGKALFYPNDRKQGVLSAWSKKLITTKRNDTT